MWQRVGGIPVLQNRLEVLVVGIGSLERLRFEVLDGHGVGTGAAHPLAMACGRVDLAVELGNLPEDVSHFSGHRHGGPS